MELTEFHAMVKAACVDEMDANTAWKQIPMSTKMACGFRNPIDCGHYLAIKSNRSHVIISLSPMDTYNVYVISIRADKAKIKEQRADVYAEDLGEVLYHMLNK
jgi:hypothetical protein